MRRSLPAILLVCAACARGGGPIALRSEQLQLTLHRTPFSLALRDASGRVILSSLSDAQAQGAYGAAAATTDVPGFVGQALAGWDGYVAHESPWGRATTAEVLSQTSSSAQVRVAAGDAVINLSVSLTGARMDLSLEAQGGLRNKTGLAFALPGDEHFFGLGERFASFDHRGLSLYSWAEEGGLGQGESAPAGPSNPYPNGPSMTWFPVPFFLSSKGYGVHVDTTSRVELHLGSERPDAWRIAVNAPRFALTVYANSDPLQTIDDYTRDTGRPKAPPPWAFGPRRESGIGVQAMGTDEWRALRQNHVPTTAIDDNVHFLPARSELGREAQLSAWTSQMHAAGFKVLGYYTPYVSQTFASAAGDLSFGLQNKLFVAGADGKPLPTFFSSGAPQTLFTIDLTIDDSVKWFQSLLRRSLTLGYDGWMHDFGEYLPREAVLRDGRRGDEVHNQFPLLSAKAARELIDAEAPDAFFYVRSGTAGSQAFAAGVWGGDPEASFDETTGLPANLRAGLALSMSGAPFWGSDIGGYKCLTDAPHDKEMYLRWAAVGAVSPIMMDDTACFTLTGHADKWTLWSDADTIASYGKLARLHTRLQPYFLVLARQAALTGRPLMLPPFLLFPQEPSAFGADDSFFLGPALFAAPVVRRGIQNREVWLPPGRYLSFDSLIQYQGGQRVSIPAPLGSLPLLLAEGQLLPLLDESVETLAPASDGTVDARAVADRLDVRVPLAAGESATLTLADGTMLTARRLSAPAGATALTAVTADQLPACALCYFAAAEGDVDRLRANGALAADSSITVQDLVLSASGGPSRRVRWDVLRLR